MTNPIFTDPMFPILVRSYRFEEMARSARMEGFGIVVLQIPLAMLEPHEKQAYQNHSRTLKRLAERGGLNASEAVAILEDRPWRSMSFGESHHQLCSMMMTWEVERTLARIKEARPS